MSSLAIVACSGQPKVRASHPVSSEIGYVVRFNPEKGELFVAARLGGRRPYHLPPRTRDFLLDLDETDAGVITYRFLIDDAIDALDGELGAERLGDIRVLSSSFWLLRPRRTDGLTYRLEVITPPGFQFAMGHTGPSARVLDSPALSVFGPILIHEIHGLQVVMAHDRYSLRDDLVLAWATEAARSVGDYFGSPPSERGLVLLLPCDAGSGIHHGFALGYRGGASVRVHLGDGVTPDTLEDDWTLTHEMLHLGFPNLPGHAWLEEGLATYVEPLIRARRSTMSEPAYWSEMIDGLPNALDAEGRFGFEPPMGWGDVYWGGALFFLRADLAIRTRSDNERSLDDALRAVHAAGDIRVALRAEEALRIGDDATGGTELVDLFRAISKAREPFDLPGLLQRLGVARIDGRIELDDTAPDARLRRALLMR